MDSTAKRVELSDGQWAEIRTKPKLGDIRYQQEEAARRGYTNQTLDNLARLEKCIVRWSFDREVDADALDELVPEDALLMLEAMTGTDPNASTPSSDGTEAESSEESHL